MSESIAVIGSNSFSGSHFVNHCLSAGLEVVGLSRSAEPNAVFLPYSDNANLADFRFQQADLNHDLDTLMATLDDFAPSYVVNFAAQGMVAQSWEKPEDWFRTNTLANVLLHDELRTRDYLKKYVHISTPEVYGSCSGLVREHTNYNPSTPYAVSRAAADLSLMSFRNAYHFPVVFTRAANVYGPGQQLYRIIPIAVLNFFTGQKLQLHGGGSSIRSFIHIRDVCEGTLRAARQGNPGDIFHFATSRQISIRDLAALIADRMGIDFDDHVEVVGERLGKDAAYLLDTAQARDALDWSADTSLEAGVDETIAWVRDNLDLLRSLPRKYIHKA
jgi:dTDP-glucose 4,6-dehydratase